MKTLQLSLFKEKIKKPLFPTILLSPKNTTCQFMDSIQIPLTKLPSVMRHLLKPENKKPTPQLPALAI